MLLLAAALLFVFFYAMASYQLMQGRLLARNFLSGEWITRESNPMWFYSKVYSQYLAGTVLPAILVVLHLRN